MAHLIEQEFQVRYHEGHVWKILDGLGWSPQRPEGRARERNEEQIQQLEEKRVAGAKKKARQEGRILVFIDESGLSQRPHRCRTWAPRGQTPILQYNFNWKSLSVAAGLTLWNFYFRIYAGAIKKEQVVDFLEALVRHLRPALADRVGPSSGTPQPVRAGLHCRFAWLDFHRLSAALRAGTEPGRIHLGLLEATRVAECLSQGLLATERSGATNPTSHAPPSAPDHRLLEAIFFVAQMTLYYEAQLACRSSNIA